MATTTNFGWTTPDNTALVKDGAGAIRSLGSAIDTSMGDLRGGTTGQILAKNTNADMDFVWIANDQGDITEVTAGTGISGGGTSGAVTITNSMATAIDAKGDLIVGTGADTFSRLAVGATNGHVLTVDSATSTGVKWAAAGGAVTKVTANLAFSGATSVSINNCFTSTYTNYMILFENMAAASGTAVSFRMRASSSDNTTSNYDQGNHAVGYGGTTGGEAASNATEFRMWGSVGSGSEKANMIFFINNPQTATQTTWSGTGNNNDAGYRTSGQFNATTQFDGFSIYCGQNLSGNITVYGLEK